ncbi:PRC-barrel domain containing protein [Halalkalicoccus sp. NIPERK01]|uniref:PRC-barrel domain containing protein n=1 Tax=Halalkalicoccus sp. NIPERK01 TaxID=3053469 RepID=UPI00256F1F1A|nr:PRC-barrel domain containing protein [Halalkalicoccus sp. NIPERK01]MDL5360806.1 PRC-barrel domain containing protein [Halalkalicoccus sp. NIPERK01]
MCAQLTSEDEGKDVVDANGEKIGVVQSVRAGTAYVNPDPGVTDEIKSTLGWGDADEDTYALDDHRIEAVTDREIQIRR